MKSCLPAADGRNLFQAAAEIYANVNAAGAAPKGLVSKPEGYGTKDLSRTRDLGVVGEGGQPKEMQDLMQGMQKKECAVACCMYCKKTACAESLLGGDCT